MIAAEFQLVSHAYEGAQRLCDESLMKAEAVVGVVKGSGVVCYGWGVGPEAWRKAS